MKLPLSRMRMQHWLLVLVACTIGASAWITNSSLFDLGATERQLDRSTATARAIDRVLRLVIDAEGGQRGFLLAGRVAYLEPFYGAVKELQVAREELTRLVDDDIERQALVSFSAAIDAGIAHLTRSVVLRSTGRDEDVQHVLDGDAGKKLVDRVRQTGAAMATHQERELLELREAHGMGVARALATTAVSFCVNVALLSLLLMRAGSAVRAARRAAALAGQQNAEQAALLAQSAARNAQMRDLSELGRFLQSCRDGAEAMAVLVERLPDLMQARHGALYLMAASRNQLRLSFAWGGERYAELLEPQECWALRGGQRFEQPHSGGATTCIHLAHGSRAAQPGMLCLPMAAQGELSGLLVLEPQAPADGLSAEVVNRLRQTALEQVALSLGNLALRESLRQQSIRDGLTGLVNRRYLDEALRRELLRAERRALEGEPATVAVLMIDVDHFKRFNDIHGHELGDRVLRAVAQVLGKAARGSDLAARYGGEEFTVVMPELPHSMVLARAEALRAAVEALPAVTEGRAHGPVTISVGVALYPGDGQSPETLLASADQALYAAKRAGRNRVMPAAAAAQAATTQAPAGPASSLEAAAPILLNRS